MNPSPIFDRVYGDIRRRILSGSWLPGQRIDLPHLADELGASTTPVRDTLNRLVGEHLLDIGIGDGFAMPAMTEPDLCDLYDWQHALLMLATRGRHRPAGLPPVATTPPPARPESVSALFFAIASRADNVELSHAIEATNARLQPVRLAEHRFFADADTEITVITQAFVGDDMPELRIRLSAWRRRRVHVAGRIIHLLHRAAS